jgi:hypothetical protein
MSHEEIDDLFRKELSGYGENPPESIWDAIQEEIHPPKRKRFLFWLLPIFILGTSLYFASASFQDQSTYTAREEKHTPQSSNTSMADANQELSATESEAKKLKQNPQKESTQNTAPTPSSLSSVLNEIGNTNQVLKTPAPIPPAKSAHHPTTLTSNTLKTEKTTTSLDLNFMNRKPSEAFAIQPGFSNPTPRDYYETNQKRWFLGIHHIARFNYRHINLASQTNESLKDLLDEAEISSINHGIGGFVGMEWQEKWRLSIGLEYLKRSQEGVYDVSFEPSDITNLPDPATGTGWSLAESVNSSLGTINISAENQTELTEEISFAGQTESFLQSGLRTDRVMEIIRIPLSAEYLVTRHRWSIAFQMGLAYNRVASDEITYSFDPLDDPIIAAQVSTVGNYLSVHGGLAVEYTLSERMRIRMNPGYESWLNPIYSDENLSTLPYSISLRTGIIYFMP